MTTTYTLNGTRIQYFDNNPDPENDTNIIVGTQATTLTMTLDDDITTIQYTLDSHNDPPDEITFENTIQDAIRLDGLSLNEIGVQFDGFDIEFFQINWSQGSTFLIFFYFFGFETNGNFDEFDYAFTWGPDLPFDPNTANDDTIEQFFASDPNAEFLEPPTTPFAPDSDIALTTLPWDSVVDNPDPVPPGIEVTGDTGNNDLDGGMGDDTIDAGRGNDTVDAGDGDDDVRAGVGEDSVDGGLGDDFLRGGRGEDTLIGGEGNDSIVGQRNADTLEGGIGEDTLKGGGGNDSIDGGAGNDFIKGGTRADVLNGGEGDDRIFANSFADVLNGDAGNDLLNAGGDNDTLNGGTGNDTLRGGDGNDTFVFEADMGADIILDFADDTDTLQISTALTGGLTDAAVVVDTFANVINGNTVFDFGDGNTITLNGVMDASVLVNDITFM